MSFCLFKMIISMFNFLNKVSIQPNGTKKLFLVDSDNNMALISIETLLQDA